MDALNSLCFTASSFSLCSYRSEEPHLLSVPVSKPKPNSSVTILPAPGSSTSVYVPSASARDSVLTHYANEALEKTNSKQTPGLGPTRLPSKRKRCNVEDDLTLTRTKRKASTDYLRKGQWTTTEERLARLLIEAFEEGYLPIYTGIRLRGYLAVQLQCDPMRVSKKLCAGTIDGKIMPKNYGQQKFKLRKKSLWDANEAARRISELEGLTIAMWAEARMRKPSFLTLSSTCTLKNRRHGDDESDVVVSPPSPGLSCSPASTLTVLKQEKFPIIYLNLSNLKHYSGRGDTSDSDPASKDSDSDAEPVRLDGESLQAAYDLLTLCSPRGTVTMHNTKKINVASDVAATNKSTMNKLVDYVSSKPSSTDCAKEGFPLKGLV
ncbi:hypothetical protein CCR75_001293 [Bremia lactucae]|uniref:Uncharacterized protein n=1 Tax=Bremia lactucae TaxID=4779 RepID=A0A976FNC7_BRELC|nr:hypothetical protein CCR75_001293 [Bremia lactucae]